jgi:hypothetical protein
VAAATVALFPVAGPIILAAAAVGGAIAAGVQLYKWNQSGAPVNWETVGEVAGGFGAGFAVKKFGTILYKSASMRWAMRSSNLGSGNVGGSTRLYHGGNLTGDRVHAGDFSTTPSLTKAQMHAVDNGGQVHTFDVPNSFIQKAKLRNQYEFFNDDYKGTMGPEVRFKGDSSAGLNIFKIEF